MLREVPEGRGQSRCVIFRGDTVWDVGGGDVDLRLAVDRCDLPRHDHRAGECRVVGNEVHRLDDPDVVDDVDEACLDDVAALPPVSFQCRRATSMPKI